MREEDWTLLKAARDEVGNALRFINVLVCSLDDIRTLAKLLEAVRMESGSYSPSPQPCKQNSECDSQE